MWVVEFPDGSRSEWRSRLAAEQMQDYCGGNLYYRAIGDEL